MDIRLAKKVNVTLYLDEALVDKARLMGFNLSRLMENTLRETLGKMDFPCGSTWNRAYSPNSEKSVSNTNQGNRNSYEERLSNMENSLVGRGRFELPTMRPSRFPRVRRMSKTWLDDRPSSLRIALYRHCF